MFQTGELMEGVDLNICSKMEALANVTQMLMQIRRAHAAPQTAGAVTVMHTADALDALTSGRVPRARSAQQSGPRLTSKRMG